MMRILTIYEVYQSLAFLLIYSEVRMKVIGNTGKRIIKAYNDRQQANLHDGENI